MMPLHTNVWCCRKCLRGRINPHGPQPPELNVIAAQRIAPAARDVLHFFIPERTYLHGTERKESA
jgi:hypothetical protein